MVNPLTLCANFLNFEIELLNSFIVPMPNMTYGSHFVYLLHTTHASEDFPDLAWVLAVHSKTIIFCPTIHLDFRLLVYLWNLQPENLVHGPCIRMYNLLNSMQYNHQTFELLEFDSSIHIIIATDKLSVGIDISDIQTVVILDPKTLDDLWQKAGQAGHDQCKLKDPQVFIYIPKSIMEC
jgi:superfamily II DNA/RNA helicase